MIGPSFAADEMPDVVARLIETYVDIRDEDERFVDTVGRVGIEPFKERVYGAAAHAYSGSTLVDDACTCCRAQAYMTHAASDGAWQSVPVSSCRCALWLSPRACAADVRRAAIQSRAAYGSRPPTTRVRSPPIWARLPLIAVDFPVFTDGRGYSIARLLRERSAIAANCARSATCCSTSSSCSCRVGFIRSRCAEGQDASRALVAALRTYSDAYQG